MTGPITDAELDEWERIETSAGFRRRIACMRQHCKIEPKVDQTYARFRTNVKSLSV